MTTHKILQYLFWSFFSLFFLTYLFYPFFLRFIKWGRELPKPGYLSDFPKVSVILPVYNEAGIIREKIENLLHQQIPAANLEIIIISDASRDKTDEYIRGFNDSRVKFIRLEKRSGKAVCINNGVAESTGDILVFTDANTIFESDAISKLIRNFGTFEVGGVCGYLEIIPKDQNKLESRYWQYERSLKELEGVIGSVCGANGGIYAIKKGYFKPLPTNKNVLDDFIISLQPIKHGKKLIFEPEARAREEATPDLLREFRRKIRIGNADFNSIKEVGFLFNIFKYGWISVFYFLHKFLRWFSPVFLLGVWFSNLFMNSLSIFYNITIGLQIVFYLTGFCGWLLLKKKKTLPIITPISYFCLMNVSLLIGMLNWITRDSSPVWDPDRN